MPKENLAKQIKTILKTLKDKERNILIKRFGLKEGEPMTLAAIGKNLNLTRERIRQIQNSALKKIKNSELQNGGLLLEIRKLAENQGGLISIYDTEKKLKGDAHTALFLLEASQDLQKIKGYKNLSSVFINKKTDPQKIISAEIKLINLLQKKDKAVKIERLINQDLTLKNLINSSSAFAFDWQGRVGLSSWRKINPKSARDKSYFILKKEDRPLHFTHIAELITQESFAGKNPTAATVHNELILDPRFVLVGRGIYALTEWGFKGGTVEEVIAEVLRANPKGIERDAIIEEVLKSKLVARNTIMMNLLVKKQFARDKKGLYKLAKS
jgi:hypothetical protein